MLKEEPTGGFYGFRTTDDAVRYRIISEKKSAKLTLEASDDSAWQSGGIYFVSNGTRHTSSLAADVTLSIDVEDLSVSENSRLIFNVRLSQRPPECANGHILYVMGSTEDLEGPHTQIVPLETRSGKWQLLKVDEKCPEFAVYAEIVVRVGEDASATGSAIFDDMTFVGDYHQYAPEEYDWEIKDDEGGRLYYNDQEFATLKEFIKNPIINEFGVAGTALYNALIAEADTYLVQTSWMMSPLPPNTTQRATRFLLSTSTKMADGWKKPMMPRATCSVLLPE